MASLPVLQVSLGKVIRTLRSGGGYSQERFAAVIKRHRTYMGLLERGKANPTLRTLHMVAEGLRVSVPELFALTEAAATGPLSAIGQDRPIQAYDSVKSSSARTRSKPSTSLAKKSVRKKRMLS
jgi:transcriptional regulator with XRE-family HTH domain